MDLYYVNKNPQPNGDHEVHKKWCGFLPSEENRIYLGFFDNCHAAVRKAKEYFSKVNGCFFCCKDCHTG